MSLKDEPRLKKVYWKDVRDRVAKLQPEFARLVDDLDPGKDYPLYVAKYRYGDLIVDEGRAYLPQEDGSLIAIDDPGLSPELREDLGYGREGIMLPAGIVLNKALGIFVQPKDRIVPFSHYSMGAIFGLWSYVGKILSYHPFKAINVTAGSRCIFLLPSIGDVAYHKNLERHFNLRLPIAKHLVNHHDLFVALARELSLECDWQVDLLFFSKNWVTKLRGNDLKWIYLQKNLLNYAWQHTDYWRNQQFYDLAFSWAQANEKLKSNPYLVDTAKHLLTIATGYLPGFTVARDNSAAPVAFLQEIFLNIYKLKYIPIIVHPEKFSLEPVKSKPVYYSLNFPTALEFSPRSKKTTITLQDLKELKYIIHVFLNEINAGNVRLETTPMKSVAQLAKFDFFHYKQDSFEDILHTMQIVDGDKGLKHCLVTCGTNVFPFAGPFLRGCVRISRRG